MADDLPILTPAEARILGCLIEKKETTPDVYPLTLNSAVSAANQKTSRDPVMSLELGEVQRAFNMLEQKGLVRRSFASRVERYEHQMAQRFSLSRSQTVIVGLLLLRGPQTAFELLSRGERMGGSTSIEPLRADLDLLIGRRPPLVKEIGRAPGQREDRYAHLLSGDVVATVPEPRSFAPIVVAPSELEQRVKALEEQVAELRARLEALGG
jgi:uncharacterized protein YceH (UPF0502 family)